MTEIGSEVQYLSYIIILVLSVFVFLDDVSFQQITK